MVQVMLLNWRKSLISSYNLTTAPFYSGVRNVILVVIYQIYSLMFRRFKYLTLL